MAHDNALIRVRKEGMLSVCGRNRTLTLRTAATGFRSRCEVISFRIRICNGFATTIQVIAQCMYIVVGYQVYITDNERGSRKKEYLRYSSSVLSLLRLIDVGPKPLLLVSQRRLFLATDSTTRNHHHERFVPCFLSVRRTARCRLALLALQ